jgi:hypothetical protein
MQSSYTRTDYAPGPQLRGEFYLATERDTRASLEAGRDIFASIERVRIIIPGAIASIVHHNVTDEHRERWAEQYARFKANQEPVLEGTPLEEWSLMNPAAIAELHYHQVRTVEELAGLSDIAVQSIGMGGTILRQRARAWLDDAEREALVTKMTRENDGLRSEIGSLKNQLEALSKHVLHLATQQARRDERPEFQTYVPGEHDPVELAKARLPALPSASSSARGSALDALAEFTQRPRGRRDPRPEMRPPGVAGPEPAEEAEEEAASASA